MQVAKDAVTYYCNVTGNTWSDFYSKLDQALESNSETGELWLIRRLMDAVVESGMSVNEFKVNKDAVKGIFDEEGRKKAGEFFTPEIFCVEGRKYFDKHIPNWRDYTLWDMSCYSMDTEILTKRGWVFYDNLLPDDQIYTYNRHTGLGEWSGYHNPFKKPYYGMMVGMRSSGLDSLVTEDHKMLVKVGHSADLNLVQAQHLYSWDDFRYTIPKSAISAEVLGGRKVEFFSAFWQLIGRYIAMGTYLDSVDCVAFHFPSEDHNQYYFIRELIRVLDYPYDDRQLPNGGGRDIIIDCDMFNSFCARFVGKDMTSMRIPLKQLETCMKYSDDLFKGLAFGFYSVLSEPQIFNTYSESVKNQFEVLCATLGYSTTDITNQDAVDSNLKIVHSVLVQYEDSTVCESKDVISIPYDDFVWDLTTNNDNHVFLVRRNGHQFFSSNCGSGNLFRTTGLEDNSKMFLSTLQEDDVELIRNTPEFKGATAFQLDFLNKLDYNIFTTEFLDQLPPQLQDVIRNDKPLIIYANPPYKSGLAKATDVGRYMCEIGLGRAAYDIYYHFMWRVMSFVKMFNLSNVWFSCFGPLTFFTGAGANVLLKEYEHCFEFIDGMCLSAQEFSDTSDSIAWGIGCTLWKSRGGYKEDILEKPILLERKFKLADGTLGTDGRVLYAPPREKLSTWVIPKDITFYTQAPLMTSHLTFKGGDANEKVAHSMGKIAQNALGTLMVGNTLTRSASQSAVLSVPTTIQYENITKENFWRCVSSYTFRRVINADWSIAKKEISAPDETVDGYSLWLMNALVMFLFEYKSMMSSIRNVEYVDGSTHNIIRNHLFYCSESEVRENCHDEVILQDLDRNPPTNQFLLEQIEIARPYWVEPIKELFDFCKNYTLFSYDSRKDVDYIGSCDAWDAGFQQIRACVWSEDLEKQLNKVVADARDWLRRDIMSFGFVSDKEEE